MGFFKKKTWSESEYKKQIEKEEKELATLELRAGFAERRRELEQKIKGIKKKQSDIKYGDAKRFGKEVGKGIVTASKTVGSVLGTMAENQKANQKKSKKKKDDYDFGFF